MTTYFVNSSGSDSNNGLSVGAPFLTLQHANDVAFTSGVAPILINVEGIFGGGGGGAGGSNGTALLRSLTSGTIGRGWGYYDPLNPAAAPSATPTITQRYPGPDPLTSVIWQTRIGVSAQAQLKCTSTGVTVTSVSVDAIDVEGDVHDVIFRDLEVIGNNQLVTFANAWADASGSAFGTNLTYYANGFSFFGGPGPQPFPGRILIAGCRVHDWSLDGIFFGFGDYMCVVGCDVYNNGWYSTHGGSGISCGHCTAADGVTTAKIFILANVCHDNTNLIGFRNGATVLTTTASGTNSPGSTTLTVAATAALVTPLANGNIIQVVNGAAGQAADFTPGTRLVSITDGTHVVISPAIANTITAGNQIVFFEITDGEGIILDTNNSPAYTGRILVQNNLCVNNASSGILSLFTPRADIAFNTCYLNNTYGWSIGAEIDVNNVSSTNVYNNIMYAPAWGKIEGQNAATTTTWSTNCGFGGNGTAMIGSGNVAADPQFLAPTISLNPVALPISLTNFQLRPGSPARNVASGTFTRTSDILGHAIVGTSDLGAYEFSGGTVFGRHRR